MEFLIQKKIILDNIEIQTFQIKLQNANLVLAIASKGYVMCGYLDINIAEKLGDVACIVSGVETVEELLTKPVVKLTRQAEKLGISLGLSGKEALQKMI